MNEAVPFEVSEPVAPGLRTVGPPVGYLVLAAALLIASGLTWPFGGLVAHALGYLFGTLGVIITVALFRRADLRLRGSKDHDYRPSRPAAATAAVLLGAGFLVGFAHAYWIADELAGIA